MSDSWQTLTTVSAPIAHVLKGFLESEGIQVHLADEVIANLNSGIAPGIRVQIQVHHLQRAKDLLTEFEGQGEGDGEGDGEGPG